MLVCRRGVTAGKLGLMMNQAGFQPAFYFLSLSRRDGLESRRGFSGFLSNGTITRCLGFDVVNAWKGLFAPAAEASHQTRKMKSGKGGGDEDSAVICYVNRA